MSETKKKSGRPSKFDKIDWNLARRLYEAGFTDTEVGKCLGVSKASINAYKTQKEGFLDSLKDWKEKADEKVERALYERATGYEHEDTYFASYQGQIVHQTYIKHYPPDPTSMIFWLKNRQRNNWKDRIDTYEHEEIDLPENIDNLTPEQIDELYTRIQEKRDKA